MTKHFCVDSDGCTINTMVFKHEVFMAPNAIRIFNLSQYVDDIDGFLADWSQINLYSPLRGANRFVALTTMLKRAGYPDMENLLAWVDQSGQLSMDSLAQAIETYQSDDLKKAYQWSMETNQGIADYHADDYKAFVGARAGLKALSQVGQVYAVSTSSQKTIQAEWVENQLDEFTDAYYCQETGSKPATVQMLLDQGNDVSDILLLGDSPGDLRAAESKGIAFYPILVGRETESWAHFLDYALEAFLNGSYDQARYTRAFKDNLNYEED
ncbi:hypothetical protein AWM75_03420 [Aerococcus urinaehominis]|uniref:Uncharacterized protein n=1 Tax=Aerococcus urinaehominis TaxID=128944 RepID=A0A0X8FKQ4_9LACT|nr:HAD hydrolase-like protein [Aerococcus urinaehominis]AMB99108.1 hypothetical protein AWM75_03420 [Aerococcus urinaehominis]SDM03950.1 FMN phosphatase YigB, HAD superfamily [Aerococcus urinaehominis]